MKLGVISDSHDHVANIRRAVALLEETGAGALVHAGDIVAPFAAKAVRAFRGPVHAVFGNNDGERAGLARVLDVREPPVELALAGRKIVLAHSLDQVPEALAQSADVVVTGHTHEAKVSPGRPLLVNPGEVGGWLTGRATCAVLDLDSMEARICDL
jgi:hypothetical protein